ncbi:hypothetical protein NE237_017431 [Protea cynaroides]|uniref:Uncharacterized protein n=1 Tax=Protea cynaroides TaxID=273540 RepID=A0A9Q0K813_9MAGN|nr:hypothetical protein NE237_017431 [Protea cynaroides]
MYHMCSTRLGAGCRSALGFNDNGNHDLGELQKSKANLEKLHIGSSHLLANILFFRVQELDVFIDRDAYPQITTRLMSRFIYGQLMPDPPLGPSSISVTGPPTRLWAEKLNLHRWCAIGWGRTLPPRIITSKLTIAPNVSLMMAFSSEQELW